MSAYALPGLMPPIDSSSYGHNTVSDDTTISNSTSLDTSVLGPLHQQNDGSTLSGIFTASLDFLSVPALRASSATSFDGVTDTKPASTETSSDRDIAVKEAKIDPVRLIQSVTGSPQKQQHTQRKTLRRRGSRERLGDSSPQSSSVSRQVAVGGEEEQLQNRCKNVGTPHDGAIEFELSISFNGRKYTATRTLHCILQLRDDLIREMNSRKRWLQIRRATSDGPASTVDDSECMARNEDMNIQIPEIPPITGEDCNGGPSVGFVGRGFTMLHAMATSYVPVMDGWLRNVLAIVPQDSECLTNFLWEPLSNETFPVDFTSKSCTSLATLGSIKELDYNTDDDDNDDEDDRW